MVAGGGAIEMELSRYLREHSRTIAGKEQMLIAAMARAFEVIPRQLCDNAGFDSTIVLNKLRQKHASGEHQFSIVGLCGLVFKKVTVKITVFLFEGAPKHCEYLTVNHCSTRWVHSAYLEIHENSFLKWRTQVT